MKSTTVRFADPVYGQLEHASRLTGLPINSIVTVACLDWLREHVFANTPIASLGRFAPHRGWALTEAMMRKSLVKLVPSPLEGSDPIAVFTAAAQDALSQAHVTSEEAGQPWIGTSHLLRGLFEVEEGRAGRALRRLEVDVAAIVAQQEPEASGSRPGRAAETGLAGEGGEPPTGKEGPLLPTNRVRRVLKVASDEARRQRAAQVGTDHLLLGLLIDGESWTASALEDAGVTQEAVRQALSEVGPES
jgi:ClpA/ClpB-like protein